MPKSTFFTGQPIFSQLLQLIPSGLTTRLIKEHKTDHYVKTFKSRDHIISMLYQGFFQCLSIRELITGLQANSERLRHLGIDHTPRRSTLADANRRRPAAFFEALYHAVYKLHQKHLPDSRTQDRQLFIIDSTTISLFSNIMRGAGTSKKDGRRKGGVKAHVLVDSAHNIGSFVWVTEGKEHDLGFLKKVDVPPGSTIVFDMGYINYTRFIEWEMEGTTWVTRQKADAYHVITERRVVDMQALTAGVLEDNDVILGRPGNEPTTLMVAARRIRFKDPVTGRIFIFLTNNTSLEPQEVAAIYKKRWQIELLFKRIKQRYPLKYFVGDSENAIRIQIWSILLCDMLVQIVLHKTNGLRKTKWSYANLSSMIKHHLMTYIKLFDFLKDPEKALLKRQQLPTLKGTLFEQTGA